MKPLSCWNGEYYGIYPKPGQAATRYAIRHGKDPLPTGTALCVFNPEEKGKAYYAVTASVEGKEGAPVALQKPVEETVGPGEPVMQLTVKPEKHFNYVKGAELHYYVR